MRKPWLLLGCLLLSTCTLFPAWSWPSAAAAPTTQTKQPARTERLVVSYAGEDGKNVLELLKQKAKVKTKTFSFGELVVEINGVRSNDRYNFLYYVNGETIKTGAANYVTKTGEKIEWKLVGPRQTP